MFGITYFASHDLQLMSERRQIGLSGRWPPLVATTAMVCSAVAEVVKIQACFVQGCTAAGVDLEPSFIVVLPTPT